ncbi:DNA polymerase III, subunits gamma and tau [Crinalium epipsammum PCC 9333]|uniref:DNA polymerase III subunit gamma/tau n=1 Tax=Crinalium epipsammum PCC 9333 TaxID=1173022 RepID=K9VVY1_9CYAN|nr:DNA polymerase III subunit gamma/tau [Crinalium epipsammum]AFZ12268.1 DNA polymerase III, subunits gamma and tau [Crinalium epipsammum PCC 9333]
MNYEPLHHKYRPQTFAQLVGQEAIATTLSNAIRLRRIAPAYLFTGARGTGKTSSARILAKSLNCLSSDVPTSSPCGKCEVCRAIAFGSALDIIEIDAASNTGVDNIRELIERAQFAPVQCRHKVYIIDEVHMLSTAAFNALLKTLEEPPAHVVFVLATTDPQRVLPTIISRCQRFDFRRIPLDPMAQHLRKIAEAENINITDEAVTLVAQMAQGGLRDAESLLDQLSLLAGQVTVEKVWDLTGAVPERDLIVLVQAIAANNAETVLDRARSLMERGREPLVVLQNLAGFYRDLLIAKTAPSRGDLVALTAQTWQQLSQEAKNWDANQILASQKHLKDSEVQIKNTTQPRLWLEVTLLGLLPSAVTYQTPHQPIATSPTPKIEEIRSQTPAKSPPPAPQQTSPPITPVNNPSPTPIASEPVKELPTPEPIPSEAANVSSSQVTEVNSHSLTLEQLWQQVIANIRRPLTKPLVRDHCRLLVFESNFALIGVSSEKLLKTAQSSSQYIEAAFQTVCQHPVKLQFQLAAHTHSKTTTVQEPPRDLHNATEPIARNNDATPANNPSSQAAKAIVEPPKTNSKPAITPPPEKPARESKTDEVTKAAYSLAKFFDGEFVEIVEDLEVNKPARYQQLQAENNIINAAFLDEELEEPQENEYEGF